MRCPYRPITKLTEYACGGTTNVIDFDECIGNLCAVYVEKKIVNLPCSGEPYRTIGYCGLRGDK